MNITNDLVINVQNTTTFSVNTETGAVVVSMKTGDATSAMTVTEPSSLVVPGGSTLTFALNGDIAAIDRI